MVTLEDVEAARRRIRDAVYLPPCAGREYFSRLLGCEAFFMLENLQRSGSFKERGALNNLLLLTPEQRVHGVITVSAGNQRVRKSSPAQRQYRGAAAEPQTPLAGTEIAQAILGNRLAGNGALLLGERLGEAGVGDSV